jgi:hypothetical protein
MNAFAWPNSSFEGDPSQAVLLFACVPSHTLGYDGGWVF